MWVYRGVVAAVMAAVVAAEPAVPTLAADHPNVLLVYFSNTGYTKQLADAIASGLTTVLPEGNVRVQPVNQTAVEADVLQWADGILLGSPTYFGNPASGLTSWVDAEWESHWTDTRFGTKFGAAFATGGGMAQGVEHVNACIQRILRSFRITVLSPDPTRSGYASYGPVAVTGTYPFNSSELADAWVAAASTFGVKFATRLSEAIADRDALRACRATPKLGGP